MKLYIPTTDITTSIAKVIAQNYLTAYLADKTTNTVTIEYIGVECGSNSGDIGALAAKIKLTDGETSSESQSESESESQSESQSESNSESGNSTVNLPTYMYIYEVSDSVVSYVGKDTSKVSSENCISSNNGIYVFKKAS